MKKMLNLKQSALAVAMVMASGYMGNASAHAIPPNPLAANPPPATPLGGTNAYDVYHSGCFAATPGQIDGVDIVAAGNADHVRATINNTSSTGASSVTLTVARYKGNDVVATVTGTDATTGNTPVALPLLSMVADPNAELDLVVSHPVGATSTASNTYSVVFHCENAAPLNQHTGTADDGIPGHDYIQLINN